NALASRYMAWYARTLPGCVTSPLAWIAVGKEAFGSDALPADGCTVPSNSGEPDRHKMPSPKLTPLQPSAGDPCPNNTSPVTFDAVSTSESPGTAIPATPVAESRAPLAIVPLAQPDPTAPTFAHGHAAPLPSPAQNGVGARWSAMMSPNAAPASMRLSSVCMPLTPSAPLSSK